MSAVAACERLVSQGVPAAVSVHPSAVPDDAQVIEPRAPGHDRASRRRALRPGRDSPPAVGRRAGGEGIRARARPVEAAAGQGAPVKIDTGIGADLGSIARRTGAAEAAGLDCIWAAETVNDPFLSLAIAAEHSERVSLGTAVAIAFARNPMSLAYTANQLQEFSRAA